MNYQQNLNSPIAIVKNEWKIFLPFLIVSFFLANALVFGIDRWYWPSTTIPLLYEGDGFAFLYNFKRLTEDVWYFTNHRVNYPWVSYFHDFPQSDVGNYLFIKLASMATGSFIEATNLYLSVGFPLVFFTSYVLFRVLNISKLNAVLGAFAYAFLSFHFLRAHHLFFTWYFVVPCYVYMYFQLIFKQDVPFTNWKKNWKSNVLYFVGLAFLAFFGGYFALFALFGFVFCIFLAIANRGKFWINVYAGIVSCGAVLFGTVLNIWPTILYNFKNGPNLEALVRVPLESELYSVKFSQFLLPVGYHSILWVRQLADFFNYNSSTINENASATIGLLASLGLIFSLMLLVYKSVVKNTNSNSLLNNRLVLTSGLFILFFVLFASVGGLVSFYALLINSTARGWNRVSIYIALFGLISFFTVLDYWFKRQFFQNKKPILLAISSVFLVGFILLDQTPLNKVYELNLNQDQYLEGKKYFSQIEKSLPAKSAIFQLPYQIYPGHPKGDMGAYSHLEGPLHTQTLRWSSGGLVWREGEWFYRFLDELPLLQQLEIARAMGFVGLYIDKRAYCDSGQWIESQALDYVRKHLPSNQNKDDLALLKNDNLGRVFIPLPKPTNLTEQKIIANQYLSQIGYVIKDGFTPVSNGQIQGVIDFRRETLPYYVRFVDGLSRRSFTSTASPDTKLDPYQANWKLNASEGPDCKKLDQQQNTSKNEVPVGRWSDARINKSVIVYLDRPLPKKLSLTITGSAVGPNVGAAARIKLGDVIQTIAFEYDMKTFTLDFDLPSAVNKIEIIPFEPVDLSHETREATTNDRRLLGLHLQSIKITEKGQ